MQKRVIEVPIADNYLWITFNKNCYLNEEADHILQSVFNWTQQLKEGNLRYLSIFWKYFYSLCTLVFPILPNPLSHHPREQHSYKFKYNYRNTYTNTYMKVHKHKKIEDQVYDKYVWFWSKAWMIIDSNLEKKSFSFFFYLEKRVL